MNNFLSLFKLGFGLILTGVLFSYKPVAQSAQGKLYDFKEDHMAALASSQSCESLECILKKADLADQMRRKTYTIRVNSD